MPKVRGMRFISTVAPIEIASPRRGDLVVNDHQFRTFRMQATGGVSYYIGGFVNEDGGFGIRPLEVFMRETLAGNATAWPLVSPSSSGPMLMTLGPRMELPTWCSISSGSSRMREYDENRAVEEAEIARCLDAGLPWPSFGEGDDGITETLLRAKALERRQDLARKLARAQVTINSSASQGSVMTEGFVRQHLAQDVKMFVWQRDQGKCVYCGDNVTWSSTTSSRCRWRLQHCPQPAAPCEPCNRSKGGNL